MASTKGTARGILAIWNDIRPGTQREYEAWYRGEHLPERLSIPGFRAGWRFRAIAGEPEYFTFYETATPEILFTKAYEARVNDPTPLTRSIMSSVFINATRALLTSVSCWGMLRGAFAVSLRLDAQPGGDLERSLRAVAERAEVLRTELWTPTRPHMPAAVSAEQQLRGPDKNVAAAAVVETLTEQEAHAVAAVLRDALGTTPHIGVYQLFCALDRDDLDR